MKDFLECIAIGAYVGALFGSAYVVFKFFVWVAS